MGWDNVLQVFAKDILAPLAVGLVAIGGIWWKNWLAHKRKQFVIKISAEKNDKIQVLLTEARVRLKADRTYLCLFHNGSKYTQGSEIMKVSRTNESASNGVSLEAQYYQNILISLVPDEMTLVTDAGPSFTAIKDLQDGKFKRMNIARGVRSVARCAVRKGSEIIGYLGADFNDIEEKPENIDELCQYAGIVEQVLTSSKER